MLTERLFCLAAGVALAAAVIAVEIVLRLLGGK
jgi:hypothetical protein